MSQIAYNKMGIALATFNHELEYPIAMNELNYTFQAPILPAAPVAVNNDFDNATYGTSGTINSRSYALADIFNAMQCSANVTMVYLGGGNFSVNVNYVQCYTGIYCDNRSTGLAPSNSYGNSGTLRYSLPQSIGMGSGTGISYSFTYNGGTNIKNIMNGNLLLVDLTEGITNFTNNPRFTYSGLYNAVITKAYNTTSQVLLNNDSIVVPCTANIFPGASTTDTTKIPGTNSYIDEANGFISSRDNNNSHIVMVLSQNYMSIPALTSSDVFNKSTGSYVSTNDNVHIASTTLYGVNTYGGFTNTPFTAIPFQMILSMYN